MVWWKKALKRCGYWFLIMVLFSIAGLYYISSSQTLDMHFTQEQRSEKLGEAVGYLLMMGWAAIWALAYSKKTEKTL